MTRIGAAWLKTKEKEDGTKEIYYSLSFDKAILPFTIDTTKAFSMFENKNKEGNEKAPEYYIDIFIPDPEKKKESEK